MDDTVFYLKTCDTSRRIMKQLGLKEPEFRLREIKSQPITADELKELKIMAGTYEALFSRRSRQYAAMGLKDKTLSEADYKELLLKEYTFLKRPVTVLDGEVFIGNSKKQVDALAGKLQQKRGR